MTNLVPRSLLTLLLAAPSTIIMAADVTTFARPARAINVVPLTVRTPHAGFNRMVVRLTVCDPGTDHCATIDDIMVDTGSTGLRLEASAIPSTLILPAFTGPDGKPLAECLRFVHDDAWGPLYRADLRMGGLSAKNLPIQIIADDAQAADPPGVPKSTATPTSNGTLGIGPHLLDCQGACAQDTNQPGVFVENQRIVAAVPRRRSR